MACGHAATKARSRDLSRTAGNVAAKALTTPYATATVASATNVSEVTVRKSETGSYTCHKMAVRRASVARASALLHALYERYRRNWAGGRTAALDPKACNGSLLRLTRSLPGG